jgi:polar amino acid transport system permease protein
VNLRHAISAPGRAPEGVVPLRHYGRWVLAAIVLYLAGAYVYAFAVNKAMRWDVFAAHLFHPAVLSGLLLTIELTIASMALAMVSGAILAVMRLAPNPVLNAISFGTVWFLRGTPLLVQLLFWYFLATLFPVLNFGVPYVETFFSADTNLVINQFTAAVLGLGLNEGAYMAEIYRAGIVSVDHGQTEAAKSVGMSRGRTLRRIVMPQAMRFIIPPTGNATISMLKTTSVVLIIGLPDLLTSVQLIYARNFQQIPLLAVACFWYILCTTVLTIIQAWMERRYARGAAGSAARLRRSASAPPDAVAGIPAAAAEPRALEARAEKVSASGPPMLVAERVTKSFGKNMVLNGIDLEVRRGQVLCLIGPSGSGKTTFLRCVNHLEKIDGGRLAVDGDYIGYRLRRDGRLSEMHEAEIGGQRRHIGMVFQRFNLFPHMTALENIIEGPVGVLKQDRRSASQYARQLLARVGMPEKADAYPNALSGGQQQRVAIARALAMRPKLILFDEPTSALDPELVGEVLDVMRGLARSGMTMVIVTHEIAFARDVADKIVFMDEGVVVEQGSPEQILGNPRHERTRRFLSSVVGKTAAAAAVKGTEP